MRQRQEVKAKQKTFVTLFNPFRQENVEVLLVLKPLTELLWKNGFNTIEADKVGQIVFITMPEQSYRKLLKFMAEKDFPLLEDYLNHIERISEKQLHHPFVWGYYVLRETGEIFFTKDLCLISSYLLNFTVELEHLFEEHL